MVQDPTPDQVAAALRVSIGLLGRRLRQAKAGGRLTLPETSALARLDRGGPTTATALAKLEQISPQSMGATLGALKARGLVERRRDPEDGRRAVISISEAGSKVLWNSSSEGTGLLRQMLSTGFTPADLEQLMAAAPLLERLAQNI